MFALYCLMEEEEEGEEVFTLITKNMNYSLSLFFFFNTSYLLELLSVKVVRKSRQNQEHCILICCAYTQHKHYFYLRRKRKQLVGCELPYS